MNTKDNVLTRIKHNFYLETQSFRQRIHDATEETARAKVKVDDLQETVVKWKKRCVRLQRKLDEKERDLEAVRQQQDARFPVLYDETLRSVQTLMDNQRDEPGRVTVPPFTDAALMYLRMSNAHTICSCRHCPIPRSTTRFMLGKTSMNVSMSMNNRLVAYIVISSQTLVFTERITIALF